MISTHLSACNSEPACITEHEGFHPVCLNIWVLQKAYFKTGNYMALVKLIPFHLMSIKKKNLIEKLRHFCRECKLEMIILVWASIQSIRWQALPNRNICLYN